MSQDTPAERVRAAARKHGSAAAAQHVDAAAGKAESAANHPWFRTAARAGHIANGLLHLVIGIIAWSLAFGSAPEDADQSGAIQLLAANPLGVVLVLLCAAGCALLGLWHLSEAIWDRQSAPEGIKDLAKAVIYAVIGGSFLSAAFGGQQDSGEQSSSVSATLMSTPLGAALLIAVGVVVIGIGGYHVYKGASHGFKDDLRRSSSREVSRAITLAGTVGYIAKGVVLALVGLLFVIATVQNDPEEATGMDGALKALLDQPFGSILLALIGLGLMVFGVYAVMRSRYGAED